jgi:hypothetical protein
MQDDDTRKRQQAVTACLQASRWGKRRSSYRWAWMVLLGLTWPSSSCLFLLLSSCALTFAVDRQQQQQTTGQSAAVDS